MSEAFFVVSWLRFDGGAHELTVYGFGAEGLAHREFKALKESKYVKAVILCERTNGGPNKAVFEWEVVAEHMDTRKEVEDG